MRIDLTDPGLFERNEFGEVFAWLRANEPVYWHEEPDGPGFWVLTRHVDVVHVYGDDDLFSSQRGMRLDSDPEAVDAVAGRMLIVTDPPDHTRLRQVVGRAFGRSAMPRIEAVVARVVRTVVADAVAQGEVDFLAVAKKIPNHVVCELMGLPREHWEWVGDTTTEAFDAPADFDRVAAYGELFLLFTELLMERRENPGDDFISMIAQARQKERGGAEGRELTDEEVIVNCNGVLAGANETTRYAMAGAVLELVRDPVHWHWLRTAGPSGIASAVEEVLRWTCPGVHALRTVTRPTEIGGVPIGAGDRVTIWNCSANRDETVFFDPDRFRPDRGANKHVTFGAGRHFCVGARVARLELATFLTELVAQVDRIELTGEPRYNSSNFTWGLRTLPVRLVPGRGGPA
ncbi:cytochrome P450 [Actinophytocola sp. KF-1]